MKIPVIIAAILVSFAAALAEPDDVSKLLEAVRESHDIPALSAAVMDEGELVAIGATGLRNSTVPIPVALDDKWQLASCTKSMTASVAAMLVEEGKLRWEVTIAEMFPELGDDVEPGWREATLEQLLVHRGGAPHDPPPGLWKLVLARKGTPMEQRATFVRGLLARDPAVLPGTHWIYSDSGYAIAGAMMERAGGESWEDLLRHRLFEPLELKTAGFGTPATIGKLDGPWGHAGYDSPYRPIAPGPEADYPPAIAPAAAVHASIADFARYTQWHVDGARGDCRLLSAASFHRLHTPPDGQEYAMGWAVTKRKWAGGVALMHTGENTMFFAVMWLAPGENTSFVAASNSDSYESEQACEEAIRRLINRY